jgi:two-component system response regulator (stage 0 sporulation protein F)
MTMSNRRVLVVDDEPEVTFALEAFFSGKGYQMMTALDGSEAIQSLRQFPIDLVVLDMKMPGVNGLEVLKYIREHCPQTKVVVVTAYDVQFQEAVQKIGVEGFLLKPFGIQALTQTIERVLAGEIPALVSDLEEIPSLAEGMRPKARLLFLEPSEYTYRLKEVFFSNPEKCGGYYEVAGVYSAQEALEQLRTLRPDILLVDVTMLGNQSDLLLKAMGSDARPKEVLVHGSASLFTRRQGHLGDLEWQAKGVKIIQNESFTHSGLMRLSRTILRTAIEHGLLKADSHPS